MAGSTREARSLWQQYAARLKESLSCIDAFAVLDATALRASVPSRSDALGLACSEVAPAVRVAFTQLLLEESLLETLETSPCVSAVATIDRDLVIAALPNIAAQIIAIAAAGNENADTDCGQALELFRIYGQDWLLGMVLPPLLSLDDWIMTRNAEWFVERHHLAPDFDSGETARRDFRMNVDGRSFFERLVRDRGSARQHQPLWAARLRANQQVSVLHSQILSYGPERVLAYASSSSAPDERYLVARFIALYFQQALDRDLASAYAVIGEDFVPTWLPALLELARRRCFGAARLYRDLRRVLADMPDVVAEISAEEWRAYGRHDEGGRLVEVPP